MELSDHRKLSALHQACAILRLKACYRKLEHLARTFKSSGLGQRKRELRHECKPAVETLHNWLRLAQPVIGFELGALPALQFAWLECLVGFTNQQAYVAVHQIRE